MRVRKQRSITQNASSISDSTMAAGTIIRRKIAISLSSARFSMRSFAMFAVSLGLLIILASWGPLRFLTESDEQFLERQRLYRRMRDLARIRNERKLRYRYKDKQQQRQQHSSVSNGGGDGNVKVSSSSIESSKNVDTRKNDKASGKTVSNDDAELEIYWDEDATLTKICRIQHSCISRDGAIVIPKWMKRHEERLESCGVTQIQYNENGEWNATGVYGEFDLFGTVPIRYHIPHFVTDLLPQLYANEILRPTFSRKNTKHRICLSHEQQQQQLPGDSDQANCKQDKLKIALFTDDKVSKMSGEDWVPMLISLLPNHPTLAFPKTIFDGGDVACFRSIVAYSPHSYVRPWRGWYGPKHPLFAKNRISRNSVIKHLDRSGVCNVQLTILNRFGWIRRGGYLVGRDITNVDEILGAIDEMQKDRHNTIKLDVSVEYFENTDFKEQISIVQKADVILGVHGAGLGNLLFARLDTPFVEVFPFGYYAGPFDRLAEALHLKYRFIVSDPDTSNFMECIKKRAEQLERPEVERKGVELWDEAVREWNRGSTRVLHAQEFKSDILTPIKLCARSQRMIMKAKQTAQLLFELADGICKKRK